MAILLGKRINNVNNTDSSTNYMGTIVPFNARLKEIRWFVGNVGAETGTTSFVHKLTVNGTDQLTTYSWNASGSGGSSFTRTATVDLKFSAGTPFNLRLTSPTGYTSTNQIGRVRAIFVFEDAQNYS